MIYILIDKNSNRVMYISEKKFNEHSDNLLLAEVENLPQSYDYLIAENIREKTDTWEKVIEDYDGNGNIVAKTEERSRTYNTCDLVAKFRPQPTAEQLEAIKHKKYEALTEELIAKRYSIKQEIAIGRQKDVKPEEYQVYYDYCEECKAKAHIEIYGV